MAEQITIRVNRNVLGPNGDKLRPGQFVVLSDSPYVRSLVKGGSAELVDPPSFSYIDDPEPVKKPEVKKPEVKDKAKDAFKALEPKVEDVQPDVEPAAPVAEAPKDEGVVESTLNLN